MTHPKSSICTHCGATFTPSKHSAGLFCSRACYHATQKRPLLDRFWEKVNKTDSCWLWTGATCGGGYGKFFTHTRKGRGVFAQAHRFAYELAHGPVPRHLHVCHDCPGGDNPLCVNPSHMFLGTDRDNSDDKIRKGRGNRGERHGMTNLTQAQCDDIRRRYAAGGITQAHLGEVFGVNYTTIGKIVRGKHWSSP